MSLVQSAVWPALGLFLMTSSSASEQTAGGNCEQIEQKIAVKREELRAVRSVEQYQVKLARRIVRDEPQATHTPAPPASGGAASIEETYRALDAIIGAAYSPSVLQSVRSRGGRPPVSTSLDPVEDLRSRVGAGVPSGANSPAGLTDLLDPLSNLQARVQGAPSSSTAAGATSAALPSSSSPGPSMHSDPSSPPATSEEALREEISALMQELASCEMGGLSATVPPAAVPTTAPASSSPATTNTLATNSGSDTTATPARPTGSAAEQEYQVQYQQYLIKYQKWYAQEQKRIRRENFWSALGSTVDAYAQYVQAKPTLNAVDKAVLQVSPCLTSFSQVMKLQDQTNINQSVRDCAPVIQKIQR